MTACEACSGEIEEQLDSCGGFIGADYFFEQLKETVTGLLNSEDEEIEFCGEASNLAQHYDISN